jgi:ribulose kinase
VPGRFTYIVGQLGPGGSEAQLVLLLEAMDRSRYQPAVIVWNDGSMNAHAGRLQSLNVPVYSLSGYRSGGMKLAACKRLVRRLRAEVVHSYSFFTNLAAYVSARGTSAVPIGSVRSDFLAA